MVNFDFVIQYIDEIKGITEVDVLANHFTKKIQQLGFNHHVTASFVSLSEMPENSLLISRYPTEWLDRYVDQNYYEFDDVIKSAFNQTTPYIWKDENRDLKNQKIFSESFEFGIIYGMTVPIFAEGFYSSTVNISADTPDLPQENFHALHLISIHYHDLILKILSLNKATLKKITLTNRQKECLQWAAVGKSYNDIGDILSISTRTVQFHISNTMKIFGVATHEQAIAKATSMGIILP